MLFKNRMACRCLWRAAGNIGKAVPFVLTFAHQLLILCAEFFKKAITIRKDGLAPLAMGLAYAPKCDIPGRDSRSLVPIGMRWQLVHGQRRVGFSPYSRIRFNILR